MRRSRRALSMLVTSLFVAGAFSLASTAPASADAVGRLSTRQGYCMLPLSPPEAHGCLDADSMDWHLDIVHYVGGSPRYQVRSVLTGKCLVAFASSGTVNQYTCNSNWADQVWAFQYVRSLANGQPLYWLRNKHSGKSLALNNYFIP